MCFSSATSSSRLTDGYASLRAVIGARALSTIALLTLGTLEGVRDATVPVDPSPFFEGGLECVEGDEDRASERSDDIVRMTSVSPGELSIEGICIGLGVRLVDLQLSGKSHQMRMSRMQGGLRQDLQ